MATFSKNERMTSKKEIKWLFEEGRYFSQYPIRVYWYQFDNINQEEPIKVLVSVARRKLKKAVDRNLLKRRIREAYRKNKYILHEGLEKKDVAYRIGMVYNGDKIISSPEVEKKVVVVLKRLKHEMVGK